MDVVEALTNKGIGFIEVDQSSRQTQKTLIVLGVARGGTSLLAGSLNKLGVFTGAASGDPVYEDLKLARAFENGEYGKAEQIIREYDEAHDVWAFKRPASTQYLKKLIGCVRNPVLIIVFRDIFSIANRNKISMKMGLVPGLKKALSDYNDIVEIISKRYCDMYLFSYDKILANKELLIDELCKIADVECTEERKNKVIAFVNPNSPNYLKSSRINKAIGTIDRCRKHHVAGWAAITNSTQPADLELYVNGEYVGRTTADLERPDVQKAGLHPTGQCGYKFELTAEQTLNPADEVMVKVVNHGLKEELKTAVFHPLKS